MGVRYPSKNTLAKYGLSVHEWMAIVERQGGVCKVCESLPKTGALVIDHEHVPRWRHMKPHVRKLYVRGVLCWFCNLRFVCRGATSRKLRNAADYMDAHEERLLCVAGCE